MNKRAGKRGMQEVGGGVGVVEEGEGGGKWRRAERGWVRRGLGGERVGDKRTTRVVRGGGRGGRTVVNGGGKQGREER